MKEFEGWEESHLLPEGWIFRVNWEGFANAKLKTKFSSNTLYLSREGKVFESMRTATEYMARLGYKRAEISRCKDFLQERNQKSIIARETWMESHTVPTGWKIRSSGTRTFVLSPNGRQFRSRMQAITELASEKGDQAELEALREKMVEHEGWQRSNLLPANWIFKVKTSAAAREEKQQVDQGQETKEKQLLQLTSRYKLLRGKKSVLGHMEGSGKYKQEHIDNYNKFWLQFGAESLETKYSWTASPTLPAGWRLREAGNREFLLSPRDEQLRSRFVALKSLLKMDPMPVKEAEDMREKMVEYEGWRQESHLPKGWLSKEFPKCFKKGAGRKKKVFQKVLYLSSEGECFQGIIAALAHMRASKRFTKSEVDLMEGGPGGGRTEELLQSAAAAGDTFAPREITPMTGPDGQDQDDPITEKIKPALSEKNGKMKTTPKHGWKESPELPEGWKFRCLPRKVGRKKQIWFLSPQVSS